MSYAKQGSLVCIKWNIIRDILILSTFHSMDMKQVSVRTETGSNVS